jgi:hypothetical protein
MSEASVAADIHESLDVHLDLGVKRSFDPVLRLDLLAQLGGVFLAQLLDPDVRVDAGRL